MKIWLGLKNVMSPRIAEEPRCFLYICDLLGHHADGPSRHYVRSNGVVGENDLVHSSRSAVERTVSFHANDSVGDDDFAVRKLVTQASLVQEQIRVAVMPWPFADSY